VSAKNSCNLVHKSDRVGLRVDALREIVDLIGSLSVAFAFRLARVGQMFRRSDVTVPCCKPRNTRASTSRSTSCLASFSKHSLIKCKPSIH